MGPNNTVLSARDHEHFLTQGYVVVRQAVAPEILQKAAVALESDTVDADFDPIAACTSDRVHQVIAELFGPQYPFERHRSGRDMKRPYQSGKNWDTPIAHVDDAYPTLMPNGWALGTFIFLTRVRSRGGAFIYFPGSPVRYRCGMARSCHSIRALAAAIRYSGFFEEFLAEPGDVLFFQHLMGHTGSDNVVDPTTRHALLARWNPSKRIVPGSRSFEHMSTIEKANSTRYLAHRFDLDLHIRYTPTGAESSTLLRHGFAGLGQVQSYALLHFEDRAQLLFATTAEPARIRRLCSEDLIHWQEVAPLSLAAGPIRTLHLHQYGFAAILAITTRDGETQLFSSDGFEHWKLLARLHHSWTSTPWYVYAKYPSKIAGGQALFVVPDADPSRALCRWGADWLAAARGTEESVAVKAPADGRINDLLIAARFSDSKCAFIADVQFDETAPSQPYYLLPADVALADGMLQPLNYTGATPPHHVRIFNRASSYWLVTFLRRSGEQECLFWGYIDWEEVPPTLRTLATAADLDEAKSIVGFI